MSVTLELKPELQARVVERAAEKGLPLEDFISEFLEENFLDDELIPQNEWEREFLALTDEMAAKSHSGFVDDSRDSIYSERDENQLRIV